MTWSPLLPARRVPGAPGLPTFPGFPEAAAVPACSLACLWPVLATARLPVSPGDLVAAGRRLVAAAGA